MTAGERRSFPMCLSSHDTSMLASTKPSLDVQSQPITGLTSSMVMQVGKVRTIEKYFPQIHIAVPGCMNNF